MMLQHIECFPVRAMEWKKEGGGGRKGKWGLGGGGLGEFLFHKDWPFSLWPSVFSWWKAPLPVSWHSFACLCAWGTFNLASDTHWSVTLPNKWGFVQTKRLPDRNCKLGAWYPVGKAGYGWASTGNSLCDATEPREVTPRARICPFGSSQTSSHLCFLFRDGSSWSTAAFVFENGPPLRYRLKLTLSDNGTCLYSFCIIQSTFIIINPLDTITS